MGERLYAFMGFNHDKVEQMDIRQLEIMIFVLESRIEALKMEGEE